MRIFWVVLAVWLAIGALAAAQRHYYSSSSVSCSGFGTIVVNIAFGPVNYVGANPKLTCSLKAWMPRPGSPSCMIKASTSFGWGGKAR